MNLDYICPFCKKIMKHSYQNNKEVRQAVVNGDTFTCGCSYEGKYNSWKYENNKWFRLFSINRFRHFVGFMLENYDWREETAKLPQEKRRFVFR